MTYEAFAQQLTGREIGKEITRSEAVSAKEAGLVVVFGAGDDLLEFRGAIDEEIEAFDGTEVLVTAAGLWAVDCSEECRHYRKAYEEAQQRGQYIQALWDPGDGYSWKISTSIPHATFEVGEDGEPYCQGIVFRLTDVEATP